MQPGDGLTAVRFDDAGLHAAVGTSGGRVALFDLRSPRPLLVKDHMYGAPIVDVKFHAPHREAGGAPDSAAVATLCLAKGCVGACDLRRRACCWSRPMRTVFAAGQGPTCMARPLYSFGALHTSGSANCIVSVCSNTHHRAAAGVEQGKEERKGEERNEASRHITHTWRCMVRDHAPNEQL